MNPERLILVYNADNGLFNAVTDWSHKFFSPQTYQCSLCRYTVVTQVARRRACRLARTVFVSMRGEDEEISEAKESAEARLRAERA